MVIRTRVTIGSRETPQFVRPAFYDAVKDMIRLYATEEHSCSNTIRYYVSGHFVVGSHAETHNIWTVDVDDDHQVPRCGRYTTLSRMKYSHRRPQWDFDMLSIVTENYYGGYFLVLPNARYCHTIIYKDWSYFLLMLDDQIWEIHFRQVFVDPHDLNHNVWYFSKPKYQVEFRTDQDFRNREKELKKAILMMIPRAFRWASV